MIARLGLDRFREIWRYYQAGAVNAAFGFGLYALLVWAGLDRFVAQIVAHVIGVAFNYLTYSRHVFAQAGPAKLRFGLSYIGNYLVSLAALWLVSLAVASPYLAGFLAIILTSILNFFALKYLVFTKGAAR